jgi:hypothetical protein
LFEILLTKLKLYRKIYIAECKFKSLNVNSVEKMPFLLMNEKKTCSIVISKQSGT